MGILNRNSPEPVSEPTHQLGPDETPPGLDAIRAWLRKPRPWVRGVRLWFRQFAKWWRAFRKWAAKNAVPAARRAMELAERGAQGARKVARAAELAGKIGGHAAAIGREWREGNGRVGRAGRAVVKGAESARDWSVRTARSAKEVAAIADVVARARTLLPNRVRSGGRSKPDEEGAGPGRRFVPRPRPARRKPSVEPETEAPHRYLSLPPRSPRNRTNRFRRPRKFRPGRTPIPPSALTRSVSPLRRPVARAARRIPNPRLPRRRRTSAAAPPSFRSSPGTCRRRSTLSAPSPRRAVLWPLIVRIVKERGPTTSADLALILGLEPRNLMRRHVGPMVKKGLLARLYPDRLRHPKQAYRVKSAENTPANGTFANVAT